MMLCSSPALLVMAVIALTSNKMNVANCFTTKPDFGVVNARIASPKSSFLCMTDNAVTAVKEETTQTISVETSEKEVKRKRKRRLSKRKIDVEEMNGIKGTKSSSDANTKKSGNKKKSTKITS